MNAMHVVVCLKPSVSAAAIAYEQHTGAPLRPAEVVLSGGDAVALQAALDMQRNVGARVTALSVGDVRAEALLRQALLAGADRAIRLWDNGEAPPPDTWAAANVAAAAITRLGGEVILCAAHSDDLGGEFFPAAVAAAADCEFASRIITLHSRDGHFEAIQKLEGGWRAAHTVRVPAVLAIEPEFTRVRHCTVLGRVYRSGLDKTIELWGPGDLGLARFPSPLVTEVELALPRARTRAAAPETAQLSAKDRLRRKKAPVAEPADAMAWDGPPGIVAEQLLAKVAQWLS